MRGNLYGIKIGGENGDFIDCELSCEINITRDMISKSGSHGGQYKHYRSGYIGWSITLNAKSFISSLKGSVNNLIISQLSGQEIDISLEARISNVQQFKLSGKALIPNINITFPNTGMSTHSVALQGTGELFAEFETFWHIINAQPANAEKPYIINTTDW